MTRTHTLLTLTALAVIGAGTARADDKDVEALRAEVKRLSEQVKALQAAQDAAAGQPGAATTAAGVKPAAATAEAKPSVEERLDLLEVKQEDAVVKGDIPGSFRIPGTDISMRLYGFAELDWVHLFKGDNSDNDYATAPTYLPLDHSVEAQRRNRDYFTIRESRVGLETGMPTRFGVLSAKIEGDFNNEPRTGNSATYGDIRNVYTQQVSNSYGFRVRHAYGQFGGLLIGQTWSTFMDADNFPETVDYNGPPGGTFLRQPQIRFAYPTKAGTFTAALENSVTYVLGDDGTLSASRLPDLVLRWDRSFDWGALSARAVTQELRLKGELAVDDDGNPDTDPLIERANVTRRGYGLAVSGSIKPRGPDLLTWGVTGGQGIGRYLNYIEGAVWDPAEDEIHLERAVGAYVGYQLKPSDLIRFNFAYGIVHELKNDYTRTAKDLGFGSGRFASNWFVQQAHAGFFLSPVKAVDMGLEGIWANRRTLAGEMGDDLRLNLLARYYIN